MSTFEHRIDNYKRLQADMLQTFIDKDSDYGDSFGKTFNKYGIVSAMVRMSDKLNRIDNLTNVSFRSHISDSDTTMKVDESIEDTLLDLANYAMLTYLQIHKFDDELQPTWSTGDVDKETVKGLDAISKKLEETKAKGSNKEETAPLYRPTADTGDFHRRQLEITKDGAKFHWVDTNETLELEETSDYQAYMNSHESLEDMVNNLYPQLIN